MVSCKRSNLSSFFSFASSCSTLTTSAYFLCDVKERDYSNLVFMALTISSINLLALSSLIIALSAVIYGSSKVKLKNLLLLLLVFSAM